MYGSPKNNSLNAPPSLNHPLGLNQINKLRHIIIRPQKIYIVKSIISFCLYLLTADFIKSKLNFIVNREPKIRTIPKDFLENHSVTGAITKSNKGIKIPSNIHKKNIGPKVRIATILINEAVYFLYNSNTIKYNNYFYLSKFVMIGVLLVYFL